MSNVEQVVILKEGVEAWNRRRRRIARPVCRQNRIGMGECVQCRSRIRDRCSWLVLDRDEIAAESVPFSVTLTRSRTAAYFVDAWSARTGTNRRLAATTREDSIGCDVLQRL